MSAQQILSQSSLLSDSLVYSTSSSTSVNSDSFNSTVAAGQEGLIAVYDISVSTWSLLALLVLAFAASAVATHFRLSLNVRALYPMGEGAGFERKSIFTEAIILGICGIWSSRFIIFSSALEAITSSTLDASFLEETASMPLLLMDRSRLGLNLISAGLDILASGIFLALPILQGPLSFSAAGSAHGSTDRLHLEKEDPMAIIRRQRKPALERLAQEIWKLSSLRQCLASVLFAFLLLISQIVGMLSFISASSDVSTWEMSWGPPIAMTIAASLLSIIASTLLLRFSSVKTMLAYVVIMVASSLGITLVGLAQLRFRSTLTNVAYSRSSNNPTVVGFEQFFTALQELNRSSCFTAILGVSLLSLLGSVTCSMSGSLIACLVDLMEEQAAEDYRNLALAKINLLQHHKMEEFILLCRPHCTSYKYMYGNCLELKNPVTLEEVIENSFTAEVYKDFLIAEKSWESLVFYLQYQKLRSMSPSFSPTTNLLKDSKSAIDAAETSAKVQQIYDTFIVEGAEHQINLSYSLRTKIKGAMRTTATPTIQIFDTAGREVLKLLRNDSFSRFMRSPEFEVCRGIINQLKIIQEAKEDIQKSSVRERRSQRSQTHSQVHPKQHHHHSNLSSERASFHNGSRRTPHPGGMAANLSARHNSNKVISQQLSELADRLQAWSANKKKSHDAVVTPRTENEAKTGVCTDSSLTSSQRAGEAQRNTPTTIIHHKGDLSEIANDRGRSMINGPPSLHHPDLGVENGLGSGPMEPRIAGPANPDPYPSAATMAEAAEHSTSTISPNTAQDERVRSAPLRPPTQFIHTKTESPQGMVSNTSPQV